MKIFSKKRWYPRKIIAGDFAGGFDETTINFLFSDDNELCSTPKNQLQIAEFGIWKGGTSYQFAKFLDGHGILHLFDYVYLDGAHTWAIDALTFFLCDKLLKPGGYIDFDDYHWKLRGSSLDPEKVRETSMFYTDEQIDEKQVKLIVDILVKRNPHYREILENKIFQKLASA